jgi:hypothetical protein
MDTAVEYTTPMTSSSMVHGGACGHREVIVTIIHPDCRHIDFLVISEMFDFGISSTDILEKPTAFPNQKSLRILMPSAKV